MHAKYKLQHSARNPSDRVSQGLITNKIPVGFFVRERTHQGMLAPACAPVVELGNGVRPPQARLCSDPRPEGRICCPGMCLQGFPQLSTKCTLTELAYVIACMGTGCCSYKVLPVCKNFYHNVIYTSTCLTSGVDFNWPGADLWLCSTFLCTCTG